MHPVLQQVHDSFRRELSGKSAAACAAHPGGQASRWSARHIVEHLVLTYRGTATLLQARLDKKRATRAHSTLTQWLLQMAILSFGRMPTGAPAPSFARPGQLGLGPLSGDELAALLGAEMQKMDAVLDQARQRFGIQRVASHFALGPLRVDQWRRFHVIHSRHHLRQMLRGFEELSEPQPIERSADTR